MGVKRQQGASPRSWLRRRGGGLAPGPAFPRTHLGTHPAHHHQAPASRPAPVNEFRRTGSLEGFLGAADGRVAPSCPQVQRRPEPPAPHWPPGSHTPAGFKMQTCSCHFRGTSPRSRDAGHPRSDHSGTSPPGIPTPADGLCLRGSRRPEVFLLETPAPARWQNCI